MSVDGHWEVCLHSLRLLQSMLLEDDVLLLLGSSLLDPDLCARVSRLAASTQPSLRLTALQTLEDLQALQQVPQYDEPCFPALAVIVFTTLTLPGQK